MRRTLSLFLLASLALSACGEAPTAHEILLLNEMMASSGFLSGGRDEDGDYSAWVELYNPGEKTVDVTGYYLSNDPGHPGKWRFPQIQVGPRGFLLIWLSGKDRVGPAGELHTSFSLGPGVEPLVLTAPDGVTTIDVLEAPSVIPPGESYGRYPDGAAEYLFYTNFTSTPGQPNPEPRSWVKVTNNAPFVPRDYAGEVVFDGRMWLLGGWPGGKRDIWYSADGVTWILATAEPPWPGRHAFGCVVYRNKIWVIGGTSGKADVWNSADGIRWEEVTSKAPWPANKTGRAVVYQDKIWYLAEGKSLWHSTDGVDWVLATDRPGWPERDTGTAFTLFQGKMWVLGGGTWRTGRDVVHNDVWYSTDGVKWSCATESAAWAPRRWPAVQVYQDKLWILGGHYGLEGDGRNLNDVWWSEDGVTWREFRSRTIFTPRHAPQSWVFGDSLWLGAGYFHYFALYNDVWKLSLRESGSAQPERPQ